MKVSRLILGLGKTGFSVARYWTRQGLAFCVMDTRIHPPQLEIFKQAFPSVPIYVGGLNIDWIQQAHEIILSPGLDPALLKLDKINPKLTIYSDIDLFNQAVNAPIIAITGSNGKSTVTTLIAHLLTAGHKRVQAGGNLGIPALDLLASPASDFYILELSSFQLAITQQLSTHISVFLNLGTDHIDRHGTLENYQSAKQMIYRHCETAVWNREDLATYPAYPVAHLVDFGSSPPSSNQQLGLIQEKEITWLAQGKKRLLDVQLLQIKGQHNYLNVLAALTVGQLLDLPLEPLVASLPHFQGLSHRLEWVAEKAGVTWINDSKATNIDSTLAALHSLDLKKKGKLILIAGGIHKGGDFTELKLALKQYAKQLILIGQDAIQLAKELKEAAPTTQATSLEAAIRIASNYAVQDDIVLLSPACASQDMFKDYAERGDCFKQHVNTLLSTS